ncbi:hypothetical protein PAMP_008308 [Pampus punctatissimus]
METMDYKELGHNFEQKLTLTEKWKQEEMLHSAAEYEEEEEEEEGCSFVRAYA